MVLLFPDNTVLINFAILNRFDLLAWLANGKGQWCATVASECAESAGVEGLGTLRKAPDIFGEALRPDPAELQDMLAFRNTLAQPGDPPSKHLGEAETLAIMTRRSLRGFFVTDDRDAARLAKRHDIQSPTTWDLLRVACRKNQIDANTSWGYTETLHGKGRGWPPQVFDRTSFDEWLRG